MTTTACLLRFAKALKAPTDAGIRTLLAKQPEACPRSDCTGGGCRAVCSDWADMQTKIVQRRGSGQR